MLTAHEVSCRVDGSDLLRRVSLEIVPGKVHALLGRNGAGKSTLLKVLSGELHPQAGQVLLNGRPLGAWTPRQRARQRAVLAQGDPLRFGFKAAEVVELGRYASPRHRPEQERAIVAEALAMAEATELSGRRYTTLSGGERARVQLARVMAQIWDAPEPGDAELGDGSRYLLLDEPTASLDLGHQHSCLSQVCRFAAARGVGVLVVLHDPNLALRYADHATLLDRGCVVGQGLTRELLDPDLLERTYGVKVERVGSGERQWLVVSG
ncbi:MAG: heme ABC transporter ATP-binding protein [Nevskia sp.]|nr:heme ABC transporter ATP-binding protein [Nevskia sp.]